MIKMTSHEIKNLEGLLHPLIKSSRISNVSQNSLTSAGDNYASVIFSLDITVENDHKEKEIRTVAKTVPQNKFIQKMFNCEKTFRNEVGYYEKIVTCLRNFQKEKGLQNLLNSYPNFYAARLNLENSPGKVDENGVLLIENIKYDGFTILDRTEGFDLDQTKLILEKMAEIHATFFAFKTQRPEVFEKEIGIYFEKFRMFETDPKDEATRKLVDSILELLKNDRFCVENLDKIRTILENSGINCTTRNNTDFQNGKFVSLTHQDLWTNNIMVKIVDHKIIDVKFIDYQIYEYSNVTKDVFFFLFSSVQLPVIQELCDELLKFYFDQFVEWIRKFQCEENFKFEDFVEEMGDMVKKSELLHVLLMLKPIYARQKDTKEVENLDLNDFVGTQEVSDKCKMKASFVVKEVMRRGWLN